MAGSSPAILLSGRVSLPRMGLSQISGVDGSSSMAADFTPIVGGRSMILSAIVENVWTSGNRGVKPSNR